jgi:hypothetical protein
MEGSPAVKFPKVLAAAAIAGSVTLGLVGVAGAATPSPTAASATTPSHHIDCAKAEQVIARLHQRDAAINARIVQGEARVDLLRKEGKNARADKLATRLETVKARLTKVEARLTKVEARVDQKCNVTPPVAGTSTTSTAAGTSTTV